MLINIYGTYLHLFEIPIIGFLLIGLFHDFNKGGLTFRIYQTKYTQLFLISMVLFTVSIFTSMLFANNPSLVFKDGIKWIEINIIIIGLFLYINTLRRMKMFYWLLFLSCFLFIIEIAIRYILGILEIKSYRIFPGYEAAFALALILPFINRISKSQMILILICIISALFSLSRGAWIATVLILINSIKLYDKSTKIILIAVLIFTLLLSFAVEPLKSYIFMKLSTILSSDDASNIERAQLLGLAWKAFLSSPLFGIGALNLYDFMLRHGFEGIIIEELEVISVHNTFLQIAAEEGLFGLFAFILMILCNFILLFKSPIHRKEQYFYIIGLRNFFIVMLVNFILGYIASQFRFFIALLMGLTLSLLNYGQSGHEAKN